MAYSFTEKKRIRKDFSKLKETLEIPYLLATQIDSYRQFLQAEKQPAKRKDSGLQASFKSVFPMVSYNGAAALEFVKYRFDEPAFDEKECRVRGSRGRPAGDDGHARLLGRAGHRVGDLAHRAAAVGRRGAPGDLRPRVEGKARQGCP